MFSILELLEEHEVPQFNPGENVITQDDRSGLLFFLIDGTVEVLKNDTLFDPPLAGGARQIQRQRRLTFDD